MKIFRREIASALYQVCRNPEPHMFPQDEGLHPPLAGSQRRYRSLFCRTLFRGIEFCGIAFSRHCEGAKRPKQPHNLLYLFRLLRPYTKSAEILSLICSHKTKGFTRLRRVRNDGRGGATFPWITEMLPFFTECQKNAAPTIQGSDIPCEGRPLREHHTLVSLKLIE